MTRTKYWKVAIILICVLLPVFCMSQDGYQDLVALNQDVQELRRPALVDGVPDYSPDRMKKRKEGLEELRTRVFTFLDVIRVYTKVPGKKEDQGDPFVLPRGSTIMDLATLVHREFADTLKFARLWGEGAYDGQSVKRDHVLHDGDLVELHV